jgi:hypothetical protein
MIKTLNDQAYLQSLQRAQIPFASILQRRNWKFGEFVLKSKGSTTFARRLVSVQLVGDGWRVHIGLSWCWFTVLRLLLLFVLWRQRVCRHTFEVMSDRYLIAVIYWGELGFSENSPLLRYVALYQQVGLPRY